MQKILVVEDDSDIQELLQNLLQEAGYEINLASDGVEALSLFSSCSFDLILLDVLLPKIDGFGVCELIRRQSKIPIIMLTALGGEAEQIRGLDLHADSGAKDCGSASAQRRERQRATDHYLQKPGLRLGELLRHVKRPPPLPDPAGIRNPAGAADSSGTGTDTAKSAG